ncbi:MAG: hypothetical protein KBD78_15120 [Oligoflexales bacterium]|nr:hypothetical protein [Oligoflexales bacterium]
MKYLCVNQEGELLIKELKPLSKNIENEFDPFGKPSELMCINVERFLNFEFILASQGLEIIEEWIE